MDRRQFVKTAGVAAAAVAAGRALEPVAQALTPTKPDLVICKGADPEKAVRRAVEALGGMASFVAKGDVVVVKPNIGWDRTPEQAGCTNPLVVAALVKLCYEAGAGKVKVFDRTCNDPRRCYVQSGIEAAAKAAGAEVSHLDERRFRDVALPGGVAIQSWPLYVDLLEADKVINVPIAKHHALSRLTLSLKNWMGVMGGQRGKIHQKIDVALVDLATVIKPTLTLLDAVRILTDNGPQGGDLKDVKRLDTVVAGVDQIAVDAYGATLFGLKGADLGYVREGARRGVGRMDLEKMNLLTLQA